MGFWTLFEVASMPILQVLIITLLGAFMATDHLNLLHTDARRSLNKIVFKVFTPCLMFASLAQTVTLQDVISWWFMPINTGITFLVGGILGWIVVKLVKPKPHLEGVIIAACSSGNLGNLMIIIVPATCREPKNPFGDPEICASLGASYASFSMALGGFFIWTYTYQLIRSSAMSYRALKAAEEASKKDPNNDFDANIKSPLLESGDRERVAITVSGQRSHQIESASHNIASQESPRTPKDEVVSVFHRIYEFLHQILEELLAPPTLAAVVGFIFGTIPWLKKLIIGEGSPLQLVQDTVKSLGDATIPCLTLILGANLTQGLRKASMKPLVTVAVLCVRFIFSPLAGIGVVKAAHHLGFLPPDPLYQFALMLQFAVPPAMSVGTITEFFDVAQEECSFLMLWTYLIGVFSLTIWSTVYMWILS